MPREDYFFPRVILQPWILTINLLGEVEFLPTITLLQNLQFRYKSNNKTTTRIYKEGEYGGGGEGGNGYETEGRTYKLHYFVLPIKLSYLLSKKLSVEAGIETAWILNYNIVKADQLTNGKTHNHVNEKPEFDWIVGLGYNLSPRLKASLNYVQGFKEQGMGTIKPNGDSYGQIYKNRTLMLTLSYSIFSVKN
jgi:hypothetical protein